MYDLDLEEEVKNFKIGAHNIDELKYRYEKIEKIVKNRTKEKLYFLQYVMERKIITQDLYNELFFRVKSDYNKCYKYIHGCSII